VLADGELVQDDGEPLGARVRRVPEVAESDTQNRRPGVRGGGAMRAQHGAVPADGCQHIGGPAGNVGHDLTVVAVRMQYQSQLGQTVRAAP
jgi:hypothetical protein